MPIAILSIATLLIGDKVAEQMFMELAAAYELLSAPACQRSAA